MSIDKQPLQEALRILQDLRNAGTLDSQVYKAVVDVEFRLSNFLNPLDVSYTCPDCGDDSVTIGMVDETREVPGLISALVKIHPTSQVMRVFGDLQEIPSVMNFLGYEVWQTGGGCTAWSKGLADDGYVLVSPQDDGLTHCIPSLDTPVMAGTHDAEGVCTSEIKYASMSHFLTKQLAKQEITLDDKPTAEQWLRHFVRAMGLGFHLDTRGQDYYDGFGDPTFTCEEVDAFDEKIQILFTVDGFDPYAVAVEEMEALQHTQATQNGQEPEEPESNHLFGPGQPAEAHREGSPEGELAAGASVTDEEDQEPRP